MNINKTYKASVSKVVFMSLVVFVLTSVVFAFSRGKFELNVLGIGATFGLLLALFPLIYGLGQRVELSSTEIIYSFNLFSCKA